MTTPRQRSPEQFSLDRSFRETPPADATTIKPDAIHPEGSAPQDNDVSKAERTRESIPEGLPDEAFLSHVQYDTGLET